MHPELTTILDDVRAQIARGDVPDGEALRARIEALPDSDRALAQLNRLLAVARAKRSLAPAAAPVPAAPARPQPRDVYRAKPTIAANMAVRARAEADGIALEWDAARGVQRWEARIAERPDARSTYADRETTALEAPRLELRLTDLPQRISIVGRNSAGRIVQRAVVSGLTSANWSQKWQQRASAS